MRVSVTQENGRLICECGRGHLHAWTDHIGRKKLSSHLPPGETDPHNFCKFAHQEIADDSPRLEHVGSRWHSDEDLDAWHLGGRADEEVIPESQFKTDRVPMGVLGCPLGTLEGFTHA